MKKDPTNNSLDNAILDQVVAGMFHDKNYAYVPVIRESGKTWGIGIAVEDEHGYNPIDAMQFDLQEEAEAFCDGMNEHIGLTALRATEIIVSSMRKPNRLRLSVENY